MLKKIRSNVEIYIQYSAKCNVFHTRLTFDIAGGPKTKTFYY